MEEHHVVDAVTGAWLQQDLLGQRRRVLGLRRPQPMPVRQLLIKGILVGAVLPLLVLVVVVLLLLRDQWLAAEQRRLKPQADEHDRLEQQLSAVRADSASAKQTNLSIAKAMADVRSSSALLTEISRKLPRQIALNKITSKGDRLAFEGEALEPNGLIVVNAYMLQLSQSSFFVPEDVQLKKAKQSAGQDVVSMSFDLNAAFAGDAAEAVRPRLADLGAIGLARRIRVLQNEQLLP